MNDNHKECIDVCNSLLRGEISAIETYGQAIEKFSTAPERGALETIRADHEASAAQLRRHIYDMGAEPSESSGAWGTFAKAVEGSATLLGESPALAALNQGEEHGIGEYRSALANEHVMPEIKGIISAQLLPALEDHLSVLKGMRAA